MCAYVVCESAQELGSAEMRRWLCVHDRAGTRMRLRERACEDTRDAALQRNQTVGVKMRRYVVFV